MKTKNIYLVLILIVALATASCSSAPAPTPVSTSALTDTYPDALSVRNQLSLGTLKLQGTAEGVTAEQAGKLLPLWQALKTLTTTANAAAEEITAVQAQIEKEMSSEQINSIAAMKLTNATLTVWYDEQGIVVPTPQPGVTPGSGRTSGLTEEQRLATRTAREAAGETVGSGSGGSRGSILIDKVIEALEKIAST